MTRLYVQHVSGNKIYLDDFTENKYPLKDIAHSLASNNRYNGHAIRPYSVAQHVVLCSYQAPKGYELDALHHDDTEYVMTDVVRPIKQQIPDIKKFEDKLQEDMNKKLGIRWPIPDEVHIVDNRMLHTEALQLMPNCDISEWGLEKYPPYNIAIYDNVIKPWSFDHAKQMYLDRHGYLLSRKAFLEEGLGDVSEAHYA